MRATRPGVDLFPYLRRPEPGSARAARAPLRHRPGTQPHAVNPRHRLSSSTTSRAARSTSDRRRTSARTCCSGSTTGRGAGAGAAAAPARRAAAGLGRSGRRRLDHRRPSPIRVSRRWASRRTRSTASRPSSSRGWRPAPPSSATSARAAPSIGRSRSGRPDVHVALAALSPDATRPRGGGRPGPPRPAELPGVEVIWRQDCYQLPDRTHLVRLQGRHRPARGRGERHRRRPTRKEPPIKAGEFVLGYPDETGEPAADADPGGPRPQRHVHRLPQAAHPRRGLPAVPARQGARPARRRRCSAPRWSDAGRAARRSRSPRSTTTPSSAPIPRRNNDFVYGDDLRGFKCPAGAHARRANPRDALDDEGSVDVRLHRMIRRGTSYGPMLPDGVLEDDGDDRGIIFVFAGAHLEAPVRVRQDAVAQRRHLHRRPGREGPARRAERRIRRLHDPAAPDPSPAARTCRPSSSPAAASTASPRACARCAGWRSCT